MTHKRLDRANLTPAFIERAADRVAVPPARLLWQGNKAVPQWLLRRLDTHKRTALYAEVDWRQLSQYPAAEVG